MGFTIAILIFLILGIIISQLARFIGREIFKFSDIYEFIVNVFRRAKDK